MKTSSAKSKGRRASQLVADLILSSFPNLTAKDVGVTPSGVTGPDVTLSQLAFDTFPFCVECKNVEALNIWAALKQAESHKTATETPLLFFKRNRTKLFVALDAEDFFKILCDQKRKSQL